MKDVALVGLSLGGGAVINFAIRHPDRVRALVVVDPSLGGFSWSAEFTAELNNVRDVARTSGVQDAREQWLLSPLFAPALADPRSAKRLRTMVAHPPRIDASGHVACEGAPLPAMGGGRLRARGVRN